MSGAYVFPGQFGSVAPCPFCGSAVRFFRRNFMPHTAWFVRCDACGNEFGGFPDRQCAVEYWNTYARCCEKAGIRCD